MEENKTPQNKQNLFFEVGILFALAIVLYAFEHQTTMDAPKAMDGISNTALISITQSRFDSSASMQSTSCRSDLLTAVEDECGDELDLFEAEVISFGEQKLFGVYSFDSVVEDVTIDKEVFVVVETMPIFPYEDVQGWIAKHVKYPKQAVAMGVQGKVFVQFIIEKDGLVSNVKVVKGVDELLNKEAIRVIKMMPKWIPGKQREKPVRVSFTLPIYFQLDIF